MKKLVCIAAILLCGIVTASAQEAPSHANRAYVSVQGGTAFNLYENYFTYRDGQMAKLFTLQGAVAVGYDFSDAFGIRLQGAYGTDAGACNREDTASRGFYPYSFKHANAFVDGTINLIGIFDKPTAFRPKIYAGIGGAYTFGFEETGSHHPWQWDNVTNPNMVFGFRGGLITEFVTKSGFGLFADFCGEAYLDNYNGLQPSEHDKERFEGYPGFPFDLRGIVSLGIVYHF